MGSDDWPFSGLLAACVVSRARCAYVCVRLLIRVGVCMHCVYVCFGVRFVSTVSCRWSELESPPESWSLVNQACVMLSELLHLAYARGTATDLCSKRSTIFTVHGIHIIPVAAVVVMVVVVVVVVVLKHRTCVPVRILYFARSC